MQSRKYALSHWDETLARNRDHKARRRVSSIKYLTLEHKKQIREFYNNCPKGFEVDHIIPIKGDGINGLHVIHNLQYLTKEENRRKGNRL
jgi:5-methylcytosine-specific restriction endonuclease McrA